MSVQGRCSSILGLAAVAAILLVAPASAWALCPNCLGQNSTLTTTLRIVGVFLLVPPAIFFVVAKIIRRLERDEGSAAVRIPD